MHSVSDLAMCLGDLNGHIGWHIDGFYRAHVGHGVGHSNLEERMLLEFCLEKELCASNAWLKRDEKWKVTVRIGEN